MKTFLTSLLVSFVALYLMIAFVSFDIFFLAEAETTGRFAMLFFTLLFAVLGTIVIEETKEA